MNYNVSEENLAALIGIIIGDGCLCRYKNHYIISITCSIYDDQPFFDNFLIPILQKLRGKKIKYFKREKYGKIEINFSDKALFFYLKSLGIPVGKKNDISIPTNFLNSELKKYVVSGFFATDGSLVITNNNGISYPRVEFRNKSIKLLNQIRSILDDFGMKGGLYPKFRRLQYNGKNQLNMFLDDIGFINPKHKEKYNKWLSKNAEVAQPGGAPEGTIVPSDSHKL